MIVDEIAYARQARARLWNLMSGGSEAYENERFLLAQLQAIVPEFRRVAHAERAFVDRFWRWATGRHGIGQVVHIGAPLPAGYPPHQRLAEPGQVVYVEGDKLLSRKGEAWMSGASVAVVQADPLDVTALVDAVSDRLDWFEPIAVIAPNFLPWLDEGRARTWVKQVVEELPPGSVIATTHLVAVDVPSVMSPMQHKLDATGVGVAFFRRLSAIERLFPGMTFEDPGVTRAVDWWPNGPQLREPDLVDELLAAAVVTVPRSP